MRQAAGASGTGQGSASAGSLAGADSTHDGSLAAASGGADASTGAAITADGASSGGSWREAALARNAHKLDVNCVRWHPKDASLLASAGDDGVVKLWRHVRGSP